MSDKRPVTENRYRCVAFDAVGTIIKAAPSVTDAYHMIASRFGSTHSRSEIKSKFYKVFASRQLELETNEESELQFWRAIVSEVVGPVQDDEACFQELYTHFAKPVSWIALPDAVATIQDLLRREVKVLVASNFDHRLHSVLDGHPGLSVIKDRIISAEIGWRKPSAKFYQQVCDVAACLPSEILMVGDDFQNDVVAAKESGLDAVHFAPNNDSTELRQMSSLSQVLPLL